MVHDAANVPAGPASLDSVKVVFDKQRLVSDAGLLLTATLAERLGLEQVVNDSLWLRYRTPGRRYQGRKVMSLVHGMLPLVIDIDSFIGEVHGDHKQGASYGYTRQRQLGYHPIAAVRSDTGEVLHIRNRRGKANTQRGAARFVDELLARVRRAGHVGRIVIRADSGLRTTSSSRSSTASASSSRSASSSQRRSGR